MPHEQKVALAKSWFKKGSEDIRAAKNDLKANPPLLSSAAFHCQQAAEKAAKGFLFWNDLIFPKTHDLSMLSELASKKNSNLGAKLLQADQLTVFATAFRYPGEIDDPTPTEVEEAIQMCESVLSLVLTLVPQEVHPD